MRSSFATRLPWIILALACSLALSACSAVKLGYNALPSLAYFWLDGYVDFSDEQAPRVRDEIANLHTWHRQQELPRVLELLARMEQLAPGRSARSRPARWWASCSSASARSRTASSRAPSPWPPP
ncbi:hypothetical protein [Ramlibacter montanisoli]|uniref:Uncharacterized protein n=1 Tax=Ramlibacter montanisoli TaxID=2732512 RepID=A0A849KJQ0_9BURK|nr:hypothetical protein [Ramlibacter montanisoli]NNU44233.1 hypothetical protein [Ramlibacter montanisoli]